MKIQQFETMIILRPELLEENVHLWAEHFKECVLKPTPATAIKTEYLGKKKLAYQIRRYKEGWYVLFKYRSTEDLINTKLDLQMRKDDMIIKFITVNLIDDYIPDDVQQSEQSSRTPPVDIFDLIFNI